MRKFGIMFVLLLTVSANATTVNLNWVVDDTAYTTTTCETGGDLILPATPPAKYGYAFKGWKSGDSVVYGNVTQNGTPTPDNPIYPTFYQNGDLILRAVGQNGALIADAYDAITGKITRRVGVRVLDGTENWDFGTITISGYRCPRNTDFFTGALPENIKFFCSHFRTVFSNNYALPNAFTHYINDSGVTSQAMFCISETMLGISSSASTGEAVQAVKRWLAAQYNSGTPVTVYYPLAEPFEEYLE